MHAHRRISTAALLIAVLTAAVWFVLPWIRQPAPAHGEFARRFQPAALLPAPSAAKVDQERRASIGSVKKLRPVQIARQ